jgi:hypothetical protein
MVKMINITLRIFVTAIRTELNKLYLAHYMAGNASDSETKIL